MCSQIAEEEQRGESEAYADKYVVQNCNQSSDGELMEVFEDRSFRKEANVPEIGDQDIKATGIQMMFA
jgi:hypothetical protein